MQLILRQLKQAVKSFYFNNRSHSFSGKNIICFGDSITHSANFRKADRWTNRLQQKLNEWRPGHYHVFNKGKGGDTSTGGYDRFPHQLLSSSSSLLLVQFGFNDAKVPLWSSIPRVSLEEYRRNLREFYRAAHARKSQCVFIVNHPIGAVKRSQGNGKTYNENYAPYPQMVRELAIELGAPSIDLPEIIKNREIPLENFLDEDGLHLNRIGNHLYADIIFDALVPILPDITQEKHSLALEN